MSEPCNRCWKCKEGTGCIRGITFAAVPGGARKQEAVRIENTEKQWHKDMAAYKAIRHNGLQPKRIDDCAILEAKANDQFEIEMGKLVPDRVKPQVKEGLAIVQEMDQAQAKPKVERT